MKEDLTIANKQEETIYTALESIHIGIVVFPSGEMYPRWSRP